MIDVFDPRYSQGYVAARNRVGLLVENHIYKPYKQRVLATVELLKATARILSDEKESLIRAIERLDLHAIRYTRLAAWLLEPSAPGSLTYWGFFNQVIQAPGEFWIGLPYMEVKGRELLQKDPAFRQEFEARKAADPAFAADSEAILKFFYAKVKKTSEQNMDIHPAWRVTERQVLTNLSTSAGL